jgi:hypothetical protein
VERAVSHIEEDGGDAVPRRDEALSVLSLEEEGEHAPAHALAHAWAGAPVQLARAYVRATEYLFPTLHTFSCSLQRLSDARSPIYLFMRDALAFWPCLRAIDAVGAEQVKLLFFSRRALQSGGSPVLLAQGPGGALVEEDFRCIEHGLLVDCGLYGSLVRGMIASGRCSRDVSVMFLGSRNPFVAGWFNMVLSARVLHGGAAVELHEIIYLVDTVESLLKPFRSRGSGPLERADAASFICSMAFLWALHQYALEHRTPPAIETCLGELRRARHGRGHWRVRWVVPRWAEAVDFLHTWDLGPIRPMNLFCGFDL